MPSVAGLAGPPPEEMIVGPPPRPRTPPQAKRSGGNESMEWSDNSSDSSDSDGGSDDGRPLDAGAIERLKQARLAVKLQLEDPNNGVGEPAPKSARKPSRLEKPKMIPNAASGVPGLARIPAKLDATEKEKMATESTWENVGGTLSKLESRVDPLQPKFQLAMQNANNVASPAPLGDVQEEVVDMEENSVYFLCRARRAIYQDADLQVAMLELILNLLLAPGPKLDPRYTAPFALEKHSPNVPFLLQKHLNHPANEIILAPLCDRIVRAGPAALVLLRLLVQKLFNPNTYSQRDPGVRFRGAFGTVYRCALPYLSDPGFVALKVIDLPSAVHDRSVLADLYTEIVVMEVMVADQGVVPLIDFGVGPDAAYLIMPWYFASLKQWRSKHGPTLSRRLLPIYLTIYAQIIDTCCRLSDAGIVHFDIKCDNFLLAPLPGVADGEVWDPPGDGPLFRVVLADFGESILSECTTRNRGTEYIKSPEMLMVANADLKTRSSYDRRKRIGADAKSDVWSVGCLLYLFSVYLFHSAS